MALEESEGEGGLRSLRGDFFGDVVDDFFQAFLDLRAHGNDLQFWKAGLEGFEVLCGFRQVHFVGNNACRLGSESGIVEAEFLAQRLVVVDRVSPFAARHIENKKEGFAANNVPQELVAQTAIFMSAFDQAWDVCHRDTPVFGKINDPH